MQILSRLQNPSSLSPASLAEIHALERERVPEFAEEGLLNLSNRLERTGEISTAFQIRQLLAGEARTPVAERARERLNAMEGTSTGALRWEYLASRFTEQLFEPASLIAMGVGGLAFRGARLFTLSRLARSSLAASPRIASWFATSVGLGVEIPTFVAASNLTRQIQGQQVDWSARGLSHDLASTGILLGCLRLAGGAVTLLPLRNRLGIGLGQQTAMFGGILASRYLESSVGLRPADSDAGVAVSESLATLVQFNTAGHVARIAFGPRWAAFERDIDLRSQSLQVRISDDRTSPTWRNQFRSVLLGPMWMMMGAGGPGPVGPSGRRLSRGSEGLIREIRSKIATPESDAALLRRIQNAMRQLPNSEARLIQAYHLDQPARTMKSLDAELGVSRTTTEQIRSRGYRQIIQLITQSLAEERGLGDPRTLQALLDRPVEELGLRRKELRMLRRKSILYIGEAQGSLIRPPHDLDFKSTYFETRRALRGLGLDPYVDKQYWLPPDLNTRGVRYKSAFPTRRQLHRELDSMFKDFLIFNFDRWPLTTLNEYQVYRVLQGRLDIHTLGQLVSQNPARLVRSEELRLYQVQDLARTLGRRGLAFGMDTQGWRPYQRTRSLGETRPLGIRAFQRALNKPLDQTYLRFRVRNILRNQGIHRLGDLVPKTERELRGFGLTEWEIDRIDQLLAETGLQTRVEE